MNPPTDSWWCAVQVRPKHELITARLLEYKGYEQFVPTYRERRRWSDRIKEIELPLFPGYVFCRIHSAMSWPIVTTAGVIRIVGAGTKIARVEDRELQAIRTVVDNHYPAEPHHHFHGGDRVRVVDGPLAGIEGTVVSFRNKTWLILSVSHVQSSIAVDLTESSVALLPAAATPGTKHQRADAPA
jgi:transcription antitermination factor NusG